MGDVKKILSSSAVCVPSGKFASEGEVQFSGIVTYEILYSDFEGKLTCISASSDYDISVPTDGDSYSDSACEPKVSALSVRLTGPRKLVAKASVSALVRISSDVKVEAEGSAFAENMQLETVNENVTVEKTLFATSPEREYAEEAEHVAAPAESIEILTTSGIVRVLESVAAEGGVEVKGELVITSIIRVSGEAPFAIRKTIPFSETVSIEGAMPGMMTLAEGYLTSATAGVSEEAEGSVITVNAIAEYVCVASTNEDVSVIADSYLRNRDTETVYETSSFSSLMEMRSVECTAAFDIPLSDIGCENIRDVLVLRADMRQNDKSVVQNGMEIRGDAVISGVACEINEENTPVFLPIKFTSPFAVFVNSSCQIPENSDVECKILPWGAEHTLDGERMSVRCRLGVNYRVCQPRRVRHVVSCNAVGEAEYVNTLSKITVYYPDGEESLFDIAKKFHTSAGKLAEDNGLTEAAMASGNTACDAKRLIIR
jgi:hypothetical protein